MRPAWVAVVVAVAMALGACASSTAPTPPPNAGTVRVTAVAGPVCPVERIPPDPACAPRAVGGAVIVVRDASGAEVGRMTVDAGGRGSLMVAAGAVTLEAQPVQGLLGTPPPQVVQVGAGEDVEIVVTYDTGIR